MKKFLITQMQASFSDFFPTKPPCSCKNGSEGPSGPPGLPGPKGDRGYYGDKGTLINFCYM